MVDGGKNDGLKVGLNTEKTRLMLTYNSHITENEANKTFENVAFLNTWKQL
jgi:hypothetical protein